MSATRPIVYGVAAAEATAQLSGLAYLRAMIDGELPAPPISEVLGFFLTEAGEGVAVFEGETAARLRNPMGAVHGGGWALTLIDSATTCAALTVLPPGVVCTTVETKANFTPADPCRHRASSVPKAGS